MGIYSQQPFDIRTYPPPEKDIHFVVTYSPRQLFRSGFNIPVEISTASIFREPPLSMRLSSIITLAQVDTGASYTSIDINLAKHLNLLVMGQSESRTASGLQIMPNFAIDINFPNTKLSPFYNVRISSCKLGFDLSKNSVTLADQNFGLLIGRDIMTRWNIIWNGPTSTVIISD